MSAKSKLLKIAKHLEKGQLSVDKFDIRNWRSQDNCGTAGCAIGELPQIFPKDWTIKSGFFGGYYPTRIKESDAFRMVEEEAMEYLEITSEQFDHLFIHNSQRVYRYGGKMLGEDSTKEQVAKISVNL